MATVSDLFQILSSFYKEHINGEDQLFIQTLWEGYSKAVNDTYRLLYQIDQAKSLQQLSATVEREWFYIDLSYTAALDAPYSYTIDEEIVSIPQLQEGISDGNEGTILTDTTDYVVDSIAHSITFSSNAAKLWVSRTFSLIDSLGQRTPAGLFVDAGGLSSLVEGTDYSSVDADTIRLHSKAAFELFAGIQDGIALKALETKILFAPTLQTDAQLVYRNFGFLLGISPQDIPLDVNVYTRVVKGLWYIAWNGPTPFNLEIGVSVLLDYPVAPTAGRVHRIYTDGSTFVVIATASGELESVEIPTGLSVKVSVGDTVVENQALTDAVTILDETSSPSWWESLSLARYSEGGIAPTGLTNTQETHLKSLLQNAVFGITIKDFVVDSGIELRAQLMKTTAEFMNRLRPCYARFSFVDSILFVEETPDTVEVQDASLGFKVKRGMEESIPDNPVNELIEDGHITSPFVDYDDYYSTSIEGGVPDANRAYYLGADAPTPSDSLELRVKYPGSGGNFVAIDDADYVTYNNAALRDLNPPDLFLSPDPGTYFNEISVRVRPNEPCQILYTLNGRTPEFGASPVGLPVRDRIPIPEGNWVLKVIAKDIAGNISIPLSANYRIYRGLPAITVDPPGGILTKDPVAAVLTSTDSEIDVFYTTDGSAPSDIVFQDILRLGGHRLLWTSSTSITLESPGSPVYFTRGTATINILGDRNYEICPDRNTRYYIYALRVGNNRWRLSFSRDNIRFEPNSPIKLLLGFVVSDSSGLFTPTSIVNAVDAGDVQLLTKDSVVVDGDLNVDSPLTLPNDKNFRILRFFGKTPGGLFDPPQTLIYNFDTVAPVTTLESSFTGTPWKKTLRVVLHPEEGSTVYWSDSTKSPQVVTFGMSHKLIDGDKRLEMIFSSANRLVPSETTFTLIFKTRASTGETLSLTTTQDVRSGEVIRIPTTPSSFFDIAVTSDFENTNKWRLFVGGANVPVSEGPNVFVVSRVTTDSDGVLNPTLGKGDIQNAMSQTNLNRKQRLTKKYVEPMLWNATSPYSLTLAWFAVDTAGNREETQTHTFSG